MEDGECGVWGEQCPDGPPPDDPAANSPTPNAAQSWPDDPFWDEEAPHVQHLVHTCDWTECPEVLFNPFTPGVWDFSVADEWWAATSQVYPVGPVSLEDAVEAARRGEPNPLSAEQMLEGLNVRPNPGWNAEGHLMGWLRVWPPYRMLFTDPDNLGFPDGEWMRMSNFEPRYLLVLIAEHPREVGAAYRDFMAAYTMDPEGTMQEMNLWKYGSKRP